MDRQSRDLEGAANPDEAAERFRRLVEGWMAEDSACDGEAWPTLREGLERNRPEYRGHFPEEGSKVERRPTCPKR
ncbi:hypothetical protein Rxyl_1926 [Rubrobacter xylanophilus DSM 9941]|uniref:Uncharacterized protein n=1 Tax=Rubrobacter xylanophilus (strain DSM 9941 / JCM 11954 / NBRC 16129 / PRD-1) TaxID=266117 RepID=Q1AUQ5_RUBXD|nr:hypothetical protein [Rubrobacter xylanophilus]ABG04873.1 hypothetical protein Rxyl_1926 [Rubrobacter xylanophilus DSM 9941]